MILSKKQENILVTCIILLICWLIWTKIITKIEMFGGEESTIISQPNQQIVSRGFFESSGNFKIKDCWKEVLNITFTTKDINLNIEELIKFNITDRLNSIITFDPLHPDTDYQAQPNNDTSSVTIYGTRSQFQTLRDKFNIIQEMLDIIEQTLTFNKEKDSTKPPNYIGKNVVMIQQGTVIKPSYFKHLFTNHQIAGSNTIIPSLKRKTCQNQIIDFTLEDLITHIIIMFDPLNSNNNINYDEHGKVIYSINQIPSIIHFYTGVDIMSTKEPNDTILSYVKTSNGDSCSIKRGLTNIRSCVLEFDNLFDGQSNKQRREIFNKYTNQKYGETKCG
jgi:hypothetical protein